ncbi:MAG: TIGR02281 family clan AA aspartic protease [Sphingomonadaceae bacterium]|nr:TIGR02281 family clan AA aspartic protease [Sphingomonadaceae bacterium]MCP5391651.1 TIGR02281 family clan AA aspartic protease [Sphingomonadaceae bacterium]MCP5394786.1 TIGR02281 family clan AA aspartic protease [Sphingomonadaceae bacterium]
MIERAVFGAGILLLAVYTFTPREDAGGVADADAPAETGKPEAANGWGKPKVAAAQRKTSYTSGGQTILPRNRDGHFYADIRVNGSTNRFLVDTGASVVALTAGDAQAAGLTWDDSEVREIGSGASGAVYGVPVVLDEVSLDGHEARAVPAVIIPEGLEISLLGQSFLNKIDAISVRNDEMVLGE